MSENKNNTDVVPPAIALGRNCLTRHQTEMLVERDAEIKEAVEREREECAALAENKYATEWHPFYHLAGLGIAKAIRARSEANG